jgi:hypothetical protein
MLKNYHQHNLHGLYCSVSHELMRCNALQGITERGIGWSFSRLPTRMRFSTFPRLGEIKSISRPGLMDWPRNPACVTAAQKSI